MAKCKKCGKRINCLVGNATATTGVTLRKDGNIIADESMIDCVEYDDFRCPECDELIAYTQGEAIRFLNSGIKKSCRVSNRKIYKTKRRY